MEQGSEAWFAARMGKVTASRVADIIAKGKSGGFSASREAYMSELIAERLTGRRAEAYVNDAMRWGTANEAGARSLYSFVKDVDIQEVGFVDHSTIPMSGASPDGLIGADGLIEIKCPNTSTHLNTLLTEAVPEKYLTQIHWQAACTRRLWCDFVSYDPRMPPKLQLFTMRLFTDMSVVRRLELAVIDFLAELDQRIAWLKRYEAA